MDTYFNVDSWKCIKCYKCIRLCMDAESKEHKYSLGRLYIGYYGAPTYPHDYVGCHHCNQPINKDGEYDEENGEVTHYPCEEICPSGAIEIERW